MLETHLNALAPAYRQYVWDLRYIDAPVCRWYIGNFQSGGFSHLHYYTNDANMNVTALVNADDGDVDERYSYDPYGKVAVRDGDWSLDENNASDWANEILYCGYRLDPATGAAGQGLYHVRNRHYHPTLGRWTTRDPKDHDTPGGGYHDGMSVYEYVAGEPTKALDSTGTQALKEYSRWPEPRYIHYGPLEVKYWRIYREQRKLNTSN